MPLDGEFYMRPAFVRFPLASFCSFLRSRYTKFSPCNSPPSLPPPSFPRSTFLPPTDSLPPSLARSPPPEVVLSLFDLHFPRSAAAVARRTHSQGVCHSVVGKNLPLSVVCSFGSGVSSISCQCSGGLNFPSHLNGRMAKMQEKASSLRSELILFPLLSPPPQPERTRHA